MTHNDHVGLHEIAVEISEECPFSSLGFGAWMDAGRRASARFFPYRRQVDS